MATNQTEAQDALLAFIKTQWGLSAGGAQLFYDNQDVDRPDSPTLFGRAIVRHGRGTRTTLGVNRFRRFGTVFVQTFTPQGKGKDLAELRVLSDAIAHALEEANLSGIRIQDVDINELGSDGTYFQINVAAQFTYDRQA